MNKEKISYYDLLTIIKNANNYNEYPQVYWHNNCTEKILYIPSFDIVSNELEGYHLANHNLENENIRYWLSECMLESSMFDKCLEIKKENDVNEISKLQSEIDKLQNEINNYHNIIHSMRDRNNYLKEKLKQIQKRS